MPELTAIIPIIRSDYIRECLRSLRAYTLIDFRVIVIDQTGSKEAMDQAESFSNLWIRSYRNLGFSKAMNTGIVLSQTPYVMLLNDDVEFLDVRWWDGVLDTFAMDEKIIAVNPMSPKEGTFGYGLKDDNRETWVPREGFVTDEEKVGVYPVINGTTIDTPEKAREHYDDLLNNHPVWSKDTVCDAIATWATIFKRDGLKELGLLDEQFYPGSGEDYDLDARAYSCAWPIDGEECNPDFHRRMVGTTKSWVFHKWGSSKDVRIKDLDNKLFSSRPAWNANDELWSPSFDVWGHWDDNGIRKPIRRTRGVFIDKL